MVVAVSFYYVPACVTHVLDLIPAAAEVCLENTVYRNVDEIMEVCAVIMHPEESCRVQFPFSVSLSTSDGRNYSTIILSLFFLTFHHRLILEDTLYRM